MDPKSPAEDSESEQQVLPEFERQSEPEDFSKIFIKALNNKNSEASSKSDFSKNDEILDSFVKKYPNTRRSQIYDHMGDDAQAASPQIIDDQRVVPQKRPSEPQHPHTLFIKGFDKKTKESFSKPDYRKIDEFVATIFKNYAPTHCSREFGFDTHNNAHMVDDAPAASPHTLDEQRVVPQKRPREPEHPRTLFIKGLDKKTTEATSKSDFSKNGEIVDSVVKNHPHTHCFREFGFDTHNNAHMVDDAPAASPHTLDEQRVVPQKRQNEPEDFLWFYIKFCNYRITKYNLKAYFSKYGEIVDCDVKNDTNTRRFQRFGFVTYKNAHTIDVAQVAGSHTIDGQRVEAEWVPRVETEPVIGFQELSPVQTEPLDLSSSGKYPLFPGQENSMKEQTSSFSSGHLAETNNTSENKKCIPRDSKSLPSSSECSVIPFKISTSYLCLVPPITSDGKVARLNVNRAATGDYKGD